MKSVSGKTWIDSLPPENLSVSKPHLDQFFLTMYERQMIWKRRFVDFKNYPWTEDPHMKNHNFTNVYRELDRASQYLISQILLDDRNDSLNLIWKSMLFRIFNRPETFQKVEIPDWDKYDQSKFRKQIDDVRKVHGENPFTTAYMITASNCQGMERHLCYCDLAVPQIHQRIPDIHLAVKMAEASKNPLRLISVLKELPMVADFLAHEFYQDFCYTSIYSKNPVFNFFNRNSWTNVGPGASVGLRLIFPSKKEKDQYKGIEELRDMSVKMLPKDFPYVNWNRESRSYEVSSENNITLHQIEMWLCEYQKYWKMDIKQGKQRQKYDVSNNVKKDYSFYLYGKR